MNNPPNHPGLEGYQLVRLGHIHEGDIIVDPETGDRHAATLGQYGTPVWVDDQGREAGGSYVYRKYEPVVAPTIDLAGYQNVRHGPVKIGDVIVYNGEIRNADWLAGLEVGECGTVEIHAKAHGDCERQLHRVYRKIPVAKQGLASDGTVLKNDQPVPEKAKTYDDGKPPLAYMPWKALRAMAMVQSYGQKKYLDWFNYKQGMEVGRNLSCAVRHIAAYMDGEDADPESKQSHLAHAMCRLAFVLENIAEGKAIDDRFKP